MEGSHTKTDAGVEKMGDVVLDFLENPTLNTLDLKKLFVRWEKAREVECNSIGKSYKPLERSEMRRFWNQLEKAGDVINTKIKSDTLDMIFED